MKPEEKKEEKPAKAEKPEVKPAAKPKAEAPPPARKVAPKFFYTHDRKSGQR